MNQNLQMFPAPRWIYTTKNKGGSEGKGGSNRASSSKALLMKRPVSVDVNLRHFLSASLKEDILWNKSKNKIKKFQNMLRMFVMFC